MLAVLEHANMHHVPSPEMPELDYHCCYVAEVGARIVGMCGYKILSQDEAKTTLLAVHPDFRGTGCGHALQVRRMEELLRRNIKTLTTNADRPETIDWYKKHFGYVSIGTLDKIHPFGHPDIHEWTTLRTDLREWQEARRKQD
jgi:ribosomal-protein-alanine N-acetyltransferase